MNYETSLSSAEVDRHLNLLSQRLATVPELEPAFALVNEDPVHAREVYSTYMGLIERMSMLDANDLAKIKRAKERMQGEVGSASKVGADDIVAALGDDKAKLSVIAAHSLDPTSLYYSPAVDTLAERLVGGHELKVSGRTPSDHDPESLKVIWGHTVITGQEALLHFLTMHYLERYMAEALSGEGIELAWQKDFFINAMTDVVILNGLADSNDLTFQLWATPKEQGGLGWVTPDRLNSYREP